MNRLYRSTTDVKISGVCGGLAETYNLDPTIVRLGFVFLGLVTGLIPLLITYFMGYLIIPKKPAA